MMTKERTKTNINHPRSLKTSIEIQFGIKDKSLPTKKEIKKWILAAATKDIKVTIRIIGESEGKKLNYFFRGKKNATNVLSFPYNYCSPLQGDIAICLPVVKREALQQNKTTTSHLAHMIIHGILHLHGFTHEDSNDAKLMEDREKILLNRLGFKNPYQKHGLI